MSRVPTVRGPVEVADLGPTYMHEHIFVLTSDVQQNYPAERGSEEDRIADAAAQLRALAAQGVRTIVDLTVVGLGRYLPASSASQIRCPNSTSSRPPACTPGTLSRCSSPSAARR